jgi:hypothetical protein
LVPVHKQPGLKAGAFSPALLIPVATTGTNGLYKSGLKVFFPPVLQVIVVGWGMHTSDLPLFGWHKSQVANNKPKQSNCNNHVVVEGNPIATTSGLCCGSRRHLPLPPFSTKKTRTLNQVYSEHVIFRFDRCLPMHNYPHMSQEIYVDIKYKNIFLEDSDIIYFIL